MRPNNSYLVSILVAFFLIGLLSESIGAKEKLENPRIVVLKSKRRMQVYSGSELVKTYRIALGSNPVPPKKQQGDYATPEGEYYVCGKNPQSAYFMALALSYPSAADADRGLKEGLITKEQSSRIKAALKQKRCPPFNTRLGGEVEIHGMGSARDWTWGCVALESVDVKELYGLIPVGTPVVIKP